MRIFGLLILGALLMVGTAARAEMMRVGDNVIFNAPGFATWAPSESTKTCVEKTNVVDVSAVAGVDCFGTSHGCTMVVRQYEVQENSCGGSVIWYNGHGEPYGNCMQKVKKKALYLFPTRQSAMDWLNADPARLKWDIVGVFDLSPGVAPRLVDTEKKEIVQTWTVGK